MKIIIFKNVDDLQKYCAKRFIDQVKLKPDSRIGFATGVSPVVTYKYIIEDYLKNKTDWKNVTSFNLDEFVGIDLNHPQAFIKQMKTNLFDHINIQTQNINIPNAQAVDLHQEVLRYENLIREKPIDFQYISLGINGHMAYNEPGTLFETNTHVAKLTSATIVDMVNKKKFSSVNDSPTHAITMGIQTILKYTKNVIMVSYGESKAKVTKAMIEATPNSNVTASYLQLHPNCTFVLDEQAAKLLDPKTLLKAEKK